VGKIGENGRGQRGLEKRDNRGKLRHDHYKLEAVDVHVSGVLVMEVKSVAHVIRPRDIKPETKGFAIGTAIVLTRITKADGGGVVGKNMADSDGPRLRLVRQVLIQGLEFAARPPSGKTNYSAT
jgi:hypothetical protein